MQILANVIASFMLVTAVPAGASVGALLAMIIELLGTNEHKATWTSVAVTAIAVVVLNGLFQLMVRCVQQTPREVILGFSRPFWMSVLLVSWLVGFGSLFAMVFIA